MSFLLNTPIRKLFYVHRNRDNVYFKISYWMVSTALKGSYTLTRADAARIIWERNPQWIL